MTDKNKLIESMANLIQHVSASHKHQQEIFATLSLTDLNKILSNLDDTNEKLRKTTLVLLAELLYDNVPLQRRFCELTGIPDYTGKIVLTRNFPKNILNDAQALQQITKILKEDSNQIEQKGLFWYIDSLSKPKIIQIGKRNSITIDPFNCIVGIWVLEEDNSIANTRDTKGSISIIEKPEQKQVKYQKQEKVQSNFFLPIPKYQYKNINPVNGKVRLNRSEHIEKYQQHVFKPETPMKGSLTEDQNGFITVRARDNRNHAWVPQTPTLPRTEIKPTANSQTLRVTANTMSESKSYQPSVSTFDTMRYIKTNNYVNTSVNRVDYRGFEPMIRNQIEGSSNMAQFSHSTNTNNLYQIGSMGNQEKPVYGYRKN